jgi:glyoxylase-like metal-dependent hydrolase (beta-lactamase superfamily II)
MPGTAHPKIHRVSFASNLYLIDSDDAGLILIDAGMPGARKPVRSALRALSKQLSDIQHILVTHADPDHIGSLAGIKAESGATVYAGQQAKGHVENHTLPPHVPPLMKPFLWPIMPFIKTTTVEVVVETGTRLDLAGGIVCIATPGHSPDHFAYYWEPERALFAGDLFFRLGKLGLTPGVMAWDTAASKASAAEVLGLEPRFIFTGHGSPLDTINDADAAEVAALQQNV